VTLTPAAGIQYVGARNAEHESFLDGVATQSVGKTGNHGIFLPVELSARYDMPAGTEGGLRLEGVAGYAYNLNGDGMTGSVTHLGLGPAAGSVELHGRGNVRHTYRIGAGVRYVQRSFDAEIAYDLVGGSGEGTHRAMANVGLAF
jgi:hypothetical protein